MHILKDEMQMHERAGERMRGWRQPELVWRMILIGILVVAGLMQMPPAGVHSSSELKMNIPEPAPGEKLVCLTFDDGPHPEHTAALLDGLKQRGVKATFFLVGTQINYAPGLVHRIAGEGHQIGVHTLEHVQVDGLAQEEFQWQVEGMRRLLYSMLGEQDLWLRPPYGSLDENALAWADSPVVLWSVDPEDWKDEDAKRIANHIINNTRDGDIILMHDIYPSSVEAALTAVDTLRERGYRFVTVRELLESRGCEPAPGQVYRRAAGKTQG